jgi:two-component system cell cycle sensor histidine kinase/response regulator CckA
MSSRPEGVPANRAREEPVSRPLRVLIVEDSLEDAGALVLRLRGAGFDPACERVDTPEAMGAALHRQSWDIVLCDCAMPAFDPDTALAMARQKDPDLPFVIVSGTIGEEKAADLMRAGANDYICKGNLSRLTAAVDRELREAANRRARRELETERKTLKEQYLQSQKMEAIGQLAGGVAHDFNNLLTVILGYSDLLLSGMGDANPRRDLVEQMKGAGERAAGLTRQLLAFSRRQVLAPRVLDLNAVVADLEKMLRRVIGEDVTLTTDLQPDLDPVKADPGQIEQVLMNLAVNARDAMPTGGSLVIETRNVELDDASIRSGPHVLLAIADTGHGMTPEIRARIFEPFFTTKEKGKGTGLGLATVYGIVQQSGGHIAVSSKPGQGTIFKVYLPRTQEVVARGKSPRTTAPAPRGSEMVLLVEDEDAVRSLARLVLRRAGYRVLEAADGDEALRVVGRHQGPIHLLVADVVLPGQDGRQVAERLLGSHPGLKVLFLSGYTEDAVVRHGILEDQVHFLAKPYSPAVLAQKVREVLDAPA